MTKTEIEQTILREAHALSSNGLHEVLDFIYFIRLKEQRKAKASSNSSPIEQELQALNAGSLRHLEEEFANYKERYPHE
jgi:hypothetical protein